MPKITDLTTGTVSDDDEILIVDGGSTRKSTVGALKAAIGAGVASVDGDTGAVDLSGSYAPLVTELTLPPNSPNGTIVDLNGVAANSFAQSGTTYAEWTLTLPSYWATFDIVLRYATALTTGNIVVRPDRVFLGVGDAIAVTTGSPVTLSPSGSALAVKQATLASGVTATASKILSLRLTRLGDDASDTLAGALYLNAVLLQRAS